MSAREVYQNVLYFLDLTSSPDLIWAVLPLAIATVVMLAYFSKYRDEKGGWNTYTSNSLVLLFVSMELLRFLYGINDAGAVNFLEFPYKFGVSLFVLLLGIVTLFLNFGHFLPEKWAMYITSPLTVNLVAYVLILFVHSALESRYVVLSLFVLFVFLILVLNLLKKGVVRLFVQLKRAKQREKVEEIVESKKNIVERKKEIKKEEKEVLKGKKKIEKEEKVEEKKKLQEFDRQKKEALKLKKAVRKPLKK